MASKCEFCANYSYDYESENYVCDINLDMDEMEKFMGGSYSDCPYFENGDEYNLVRKQN